jgi:copper homeostasis protein
MNRKILLEISVDSAESAVAAERGGADRVELCSNLLEGGVTPSAGMIAATRRRIAIPLHVMIRPRGGDFCCSEEEFEAMRHDVDAAKALGANGIALGILTAAGHVDIDRTRELAERAQPLSLTFHRAFDFVSDLSHSLEDAIRAGAHRILTSGGAPKAEDALPTLAALVQKAGNRVGIMVCGGVRAHNVRQILQATRAAEIHVGQSGVAVPAPPAPHYGSSRIRLSEIAAPSAGRCVVSAEKVRQLIEAF